MPATAPFGVESPTLRLLRGMLLLTLLLGVAGTLAELFLLEHYEEWWQRVPLVLLGAALPLIVVCALKPLPVVLRALQGLMLVCLVAGVLGVYRHFSGNVEFELEMYPSRAGWELFWESLKGATPVLAPASLSWLGLVGLAYAFRHPALARR